ncbi:MAG: ComEC/Rec2 family competence protein [Candidatus Obscuribacterales bacterium]|jgi:competence protein ComEC
MPVLNGRCDVVAPSVKPDLPARLPAALLAGLESGFNACFAVYPRLFVLLSAFVLCGCAAAVLTANGLLLAVIAIGIVCGIARRSFLFGCLLCAFTLLSFGYAQWRLRLMERSDIATLTGLPAIVFAGRVIAVEGDAGHLNSAKRQQRRLQIAVTTVLFPSARQYQGVVLVVSHQAGETLRAGDRVVVKGKLTRPGHAAHPYDFDYGGYLKRRGILSLLRDESGQSIVPLPADQLPADRISQFVDCLYLLGAQVDRLRSGIVESHRRTLGTQLGDLLSSIVIGSRAVNPPQQLVDDFRNVGLSHLLAASGFNLTIASGSLYFVAARLLSSDWLISTLSLSGILAFCLLSGASPSVNRAAVMCTLTLLCRALYRSPHTPAIISLALMGTVLLDPLSITDIGLQLSYCAAIGIVLVSGSMQETLTACRLHKVPSAAIGVILAAQLAVLPVLLYHFWQVGTMFLVTNLLVAPAVAPLTVVGFVSSLTASLEPVVPAFAHLTWLCDLICRLPLEFLIVVARFFAADGANRLVIGPPTTLSIALYYAAFLLAALSARLRRHRLPAAVVFVATLLFLFWRAPLPAVTVTRFATGTITLTADHHAVLNGRLTPRIVRYLTYMGVDVKRNLKIAPSKE